MRFWKETLLTGILFVAITSSVLYTACSQDPCTNLVCKNSGVCLNGLCKCPTGYEGAECQTNAADKFIGTYIGSIKCDIGNSIIDTVDITLASEPNNVNIVEHINGYNFTGVASGSAIQVNSPSNTNVTATLSDLNNLTLYVQQISGTTSSNCTFVGGR